jgi:hypothetical protein
MKTKSFILAIACVLAFSLTPFAHTVLPSYSNAITSSTGVPIRATITVYSAGTTTLVSIFSSSAGAVLANPFQTDTLGRFTFYAARGTYDIKVSGSFTTYTLPDVPLGLAGELGITSTATGLTYTEATRTFSLTANYMIPGPATSGFFLKAGGAGVTPAFAQIVQADVDGLKTSDSPTFNLATFSGLTASLPVVTNSSKGLASVAYATFKASLSIAQADVSGLTTSSSPMFAGLSFGATTAAGLRLNNLTATQVAAISAPLAGQVVWDTTAGRMRWYTGAAWTDGAVRLAGDTMTGRLSIIMASNPGASYAPLYITRDIQQGPQVILESYNSTGGYPPGAPLQYRFARGTLASPTALQALDAFGFFGGRGYNGSDWTGYAPAGIYYQANENWTTTANGSFMKFETTVDGTAVHVEQMRLHDSGGLAIGPSYVATDPGVGSVILSGSLGVGATLIHRGTPDIVSAAGAISVTTAITHVVTNGTGTVLTLADGAEGQVKYIVLKTLTAGGQTDVITPAHASGYTTITMSAAGQSVHLLFTNGAWVVVGYFGSVIA